MVAASRAARCSWSRPPGPLGAHGRGLPGRSVLMVAASRAARARSRPGPTLLIRQPTVSPSGVGQGVVFVDEGLALVDGLVVLAHDGVVLGDHGVVGAHRAA